MEIIQEMFDKGELSYKNQPKMQAAVNTVNLSCVSLCATSVEKEANENDSDEENDTFEFLIPNPGKLEEPQENLTVGTSSLQDPVQVDLEASSYNMAPSSYY